MSEDSIPKLKHGMKLFIPGNKKGKFFHLHSAVMSSPIYPPLPGAFRQAAELMIDAHLAASGPHNDSLLFPVLYTYRHGLELQLKELLLLGIRIGFFDEAAVEALLDDKKGIANEHGLYALWNKAMELLSHSYPGDPQPKVAESMVSAVHQIDKDGQTLRYNRTKGMKLRRPKYPNLGDDQKGPVYEIPETIDIANLREKMAVLFHYLDSSYGGILDKWDAEREAM
jgi:hypothetical protein